MKKNPPALITNRGHVDQSHMGDILYAVAKTIEESLISSGAIPGIDYKILDVFQMAQPFVLSRFSEQGLDFNTTFPDQFT